MTSRQLRDANVPVAQHASDRSCSKGCPVCSLLIGNTYWHYGNISLVLADDDWYRSPTYDMLPRLYMPIAGEVVPQYLAADQMVPTANTLDVWPEAQILALEFWEAVTQEEHISSGFGELALGNALALAAVLGISEN